MIHNLHSHPNSNSLKGERKTKVERILYISFLALTCWFSFRPLSGLVGATPLGIILLFLLIRRIKFVDISIFLSFVLICLISSVNHFNWVELILLLLGPAIFIYLKENPPQNIARIIYFFVYIFFLEAIIGTILSESIVRSASILTQEPSHSARTFYSFLSVLLYCRRKDCTYLCLLAICFVALNRSGTSFVFAMAFVTAANIELFKIRNTLKIAFWSAIITSITFQLITFYPNFRISQLLLANIFEASYLNFTPVQILQAIGGPRLVLSASAYSVGGFFGHGIGSSQELFAIVTGGTTLDPSQIGFIVESLEIVPSSYGSQIVFEAGYLALGMLLLWLFLSRRVGRINFVLFCFGVFQLLLLSTTTMPTPWIYLALACWKWK